MAAPWVATGPSSGRTLTLLYREHAVDVFRFALHLTGRREDAEDVVQHAFLQAHRHLEAGGELVNPRAWLMTTAKHRSFNLLRDRREIPLDRGLPAEPSRVAAHEAAIELASVRALLWTLPESQHHAFVLRHWSGLSQNEIAEVLETTPSAVESLLVRARATLVAEYAGASAECEGVRRRLVEALSLGDTQAVHVQTCGRCRTAQTRLKRTAELASVLTLVPSAHVAHTLAGLVPGFSAQAATASTAVAGSTATAGAAGGGGASSTIGSATAVSTAGKAVLGAKVAVALVATTAAMVVTHPAPDSIASALFRHLRHPAAAQRPLGSAAVATSHPTSNPRSPSQPVGTGKPAQTGRPAGTGKPVGTGKPTHTGKPAGTGKPTHTGKPAGTGKPTHTGKPAGTGKPTHTGKPAGTGKPTHTGKPTDTGSGKPT